MILQFFWKLWKHKFLLITAFVCFSYFSRAQSISALEDSINLKELSTSEKIKLHNLLAREYSFVSPMKAINNAVLALELSRRENNEIGVANAYRILGSVYSQNESFFQSYEFFMSALDIFISRKDTIGIANIYLSLGHYYKRLKKTEIQIEYHKKSLDIFRSIGIRNRIGVASHNLSEAYFDNGEFEKSRQLVEEAISIVKALDIQAVLSSCYNILGKLELQEKDLVTAELNFKKVLDISKQLGEDSQKLATVSALYSLAEIYRQKGRFDVMIYYLNRALDFKDTVLLPDKLSLIYLRLVHYYNDIGYSDSVKFHLNAFQDIIQERDRKSNQDRFELIHSVDKSQRLKNEKETLLNNNLAQESKLEYAYTSIVFILVMVIFLISTLILNIRKSSKLVKQQETIEHQKQKLETLNSTKDKFFSIVAHDLKGPLVSIYSYQKLLLSHIDDMNKEEIIKMTVKMNDSLSTTVKMTDNLLNWARIQMSDLQINKTVVDLNDSIASVCDLYQDISSKKGIKLTSQLENDLSIYADADQIAFIFRNLISNAIKFTENGGLVELAASTFSDNTIVVKIIDNGVGMPEKIKKDIFNLDSKYSMKGTAGENGTGLGLMLVQEFLNLNEGAIEVDSEERKGTTITLRFKKYS